MSLEYFKTNSDFRTLTKSCVITLVNEGLEGRVHEQPVIFDSMKEIPSKKGNDYVASLIMVDTVEGLVRRDYYLNGDGSLNLGRFSTTHIDPESGKDYILSLNMVNAVLTANRPVNESF